MNSFVKIAPSIAALIAALSFAWIALTITETIPHRHVVVYHDGGVELTTGIGGFDITHQ
jgi:hypothetical protein